MPTLNWSESLALNHGQMDRTHKEFVTLLAAVEQALDDDHEGVGKHFGDLLAHTEAHFAQEEQWMQRVGFAPENCHAFQHGHVLDVLREVKGVVGTTGDAQILRRLVAELANWFPAHAQMMDQVLAETMNAIGFDAHTGAVLRPPAAGQAPITGCGSADCS
jgi:hemerythrin-like metal-binding protein